MKKLMLALTVIIGLSMTTKAAAYYWQVLDTDLAETTGPLGTWDGTKVYAIDPTVWASAVAAEEITGIAWFNSNSISLADDEGKPAVAADMAYNDGDGLAYTPLMSMNYGDDKAADTMFKLVIVDADNGYLGIDQQMHGYASDQSPSEDGFAIVYNETLQSAWLANGSKYTDFATVPEPTSGLLLLLGVAGMALRRRRA